MSAESGSSAAAGASLAAEARELVVPPTPPGQAVVCLEYPGYVGDIANVLETLGGTDTIGRHMQDKQDRTLPLKLRPTDKNCHPTFAPCEPCTRLLVRLTRAHSPDGAADEWAAEVVAAVPRLYRWTTPADYQYVGYDSRPVEEQGLEQQQQQGMHPPGFEPQPIMCAPPLFTKQPPFDYAFRGFVLSGAGVADAAAAAKKPRRGVGSGVMASYFDLELPPVLPEAALASARPRLLSAVRALLARRAVWPVAALAEAVAAERLEMGAGAGRALDELLPKLCYKFRNGPWKGAWTRRGFDPRRDPAARRWQCMEYHLPAEWYSKIAEHKKAAALGEQPSAGQQQGQGGGIGGALPPVATTYGQLLRFEAAPSTQSCSLQLGSLGDSVVQELLADTGSHAAQCSDVGGWLTAAAHDAIKRRVKERFAALLAGTPLDDDGGAWSSAARDMQAGGGGDSGDANHAGSSSLPGSRAGGAAASDAARGEADSQLAATARQQLHVAAPAARAVPAGGAAPQSILPTRMLHELRDLLAEVGEGQGDGGGGEAAAAAQGGGGGEDEEEEEGEEEEESDQGYQSEEGGERSEED